MRFLLRGCLVSLLMGASDGAVHAGKVVLVAGGGDGGDGGPALTAKLNEPFAVDFDRQGNLYFVEFGGQRVRRIEPKGIITTIAGTGQKGDAGDRGPALKAQFNCMHHLAINEHGGIFLADTFNNRVRVLRPASSGYLILPIAGTGHKGFSGDGGPAVQAEFGGIYCLALDATGRHVYMADLDNRRIRMVDLKAGTVTTVAGNGQRGVPKDGADARSAPLLDPRAVAVDVSGNIYILERAGHVLRVVDPRGKIRTVVGTGKKGATGDGGDARQATLNGPKHLCVDREGNVLIADTENHLIRKYVPKEGTIVRVAGTGKKGNAGVGGSPEKVELNRPHGVYVHPSGDIYIADSENNRILKIER